MNLMLMQRYMVAAAAMFAGVVALPAYGEAFIQWAPVIRTVPVYTHVSEPRQECRTEQVTRNEYVDRRGVPLGEITDGITGGVLGSSIGDTGSNAATTGGAVTDQALANAIDSGRAGIEVAPVTREVERCRDVDAGQDAVSGYDVTYRYQNRDFTVRMAYDPGDRVQVRVDVEPQVQ